MKTTINYWNLRNRDYQDENRWETKNKTLKEIANMGIISNIGRFSEVVTNFEREFYKKHHGDGKLPFTEGWDWNNQLTQLFLDCQEEFGDLSESKEYNYFGDFSLAKLEAMQAALDEGKTTFCDCCGTIVERKRSIRIDGMFYCYDCALDEIRDKIKDRDADNH